MQTEPNQVVFDTERTLIVRHICRCVSWIAFFACLAVWASN